MQWDIVAAIGALGAAIISAFGLIISMLHRRQDRLFRMKSAVASVIAAIEKSTVYIIPPHHEYWVDGFSSLEETRAKIASARELFIASNAEKSNEFLLLSNLERAHQKLVPFRDSLNKHIKESGYPSSMGWSDVESAEKQLSLLQNEIKEIVPKLRSFSGLANR